jgi:hypothetical protein
MMGVCLCVCVFGVFGVFGVAASIDLIFALHIDIDQVFRRQAVHAPLGGPF